MRAITVSALALTFFVGAFAAPAPVPEPLRYHNYYGGDKAKREATPEPVRYDYPGYHYGYNNVKREATPEPVRYDYPGYHYGYNNVKREASPAPLSHREGAYHVNKMAKRSAEPEPASINYPGDSSYHSSSGYHYGDTFNKAKRSPEPDPSSHRIPFNQAGSSYHYGDDYGYHKAKRSPEPEASSHTERYHSQYHGFKRVKRSPEPEPAPVYYPGDVRSSYHYGDGFEKVKRFTISGPGGDGRYYHPGAHYDPLEAKKAKRQEVSNDAQPTGFGDRVKRNADPAIGYGIGGGSKK